ncbi:hypothetical protein MSAN_00678000 [Mycena sanguinolenta]|uniref:Uncharacterized protein n=1 Tax=Mycena sanguinolenta TaxID=230812 RepID=A0A8H6Z4A6_9AGAR|nr:hypothetical protein MSAN_00678000 [Mycena sanguinolenta]
MRLTRILVSALAHTENAYLDALENGVVLSADIDVTEKLTLLQFRVSSFREASLRNSLSSFSTLYDMFDTRRSVAVFRCLSEVRRLQTYIEISHEYQLREIISESRCQCLLATRASISLRRRDSPHARSV